MKTRITLAAGLLASAATWSALAAPVYPDAGTQNPVTYTFAAVATGEVDAWFLGSDAAYDEVVGMSVNGTPTGITGLPNHGTPVGTWLNLGTVNAGDVVTFYIHVGTTGATWSSDPGLNPDGENHVYSTSFAGVGLIPAGTFVSFEDLPAASSDHDYNDTSFVFTNVVTVPEPGAVAMLLAGLGMTGFMARRRRDR
jgi:hypothetical protein